MLQNFPPRILSFLFHSHEGYLSCNCSVVELRTYRSTSLKSLNKLNPILNCNANLRRRKQTNCQVVIRVQSQRHICSIYEYEYTNICTHMWLVPCIFVYQVRSLGIGWLGAIIEDTFLGCSVVRLNSKLRVCKVSFLSTQACF